MSTLKEELEALKQIQKERLLSIEECSRYLDLVWLVEDKGICFEM